MPSWGRAVLLTLPGAAVLPVAARAPCCLLEPRAGEHTLGPRGLASARGSVGDTTTVWGAFSGCKEALMHREGTQGIRPWVRAACWAPGSCSSGWHQHPPRQAALGALLG